MNTSPYNVGQWKHLIPDIDKVIEEMEKISILSVGITPYTRIIPTFFLKNYSIFTVKHSIDVDVMEPLKHLYVFEDINPEVSARVHGTGFLVVNNAFQRFLKSLPIFPKLMFYTMTDKIITDMGRLNVPWIGNTTKSFDDVKYKGSFRKLVKALGLPSLDSKIYSRDEFLTFRLESLWKEMGGAFVVQRGDKEVAGNEGTFFIHTSENFDRCMKIFREDDTFQQVVVTPFIEGYSTSMLGCIAPQGVLTGPLQVQLIDVPESLHGVPPNGIFFGNDIGFHPWGENIERDAQHTVERIGRHLADQGYRGIFGIDFLYDKKRNKIFPNECNPRFTGSLLLHSLMLLEAHVPPLEFFHLLSHLNINSSFDFDLVNNAIKTRLPYSHVSFSPIGINQMSLPLLAGVYSYDPSASSLVYKGPGTSLADLKDQKDFLVIDVVPKLGDPIEQGVPRLFKLIFPRSIAKSSYEIDKDSAFLVDRFAKSLIEAAQNFK